MARVKISKAAKAASKSLRVGRRTASSVGRSARPGTAKIVMQGSGGSVTRSMGRWPASGC